MKNKFTIYDLRFTIWKKSANTAVANRQSPIANRRPQLGLGAPNSELRTPNYETGMALVITLILLSVTLVMAVAFLAISRRERNAVTTTTDSATARLAADAALANAEAQIVANIFATTNVGAYNFGLLVSTNFPPLVYTNAPAVFTNLFILPRAPVFLANLVTHTNENRFYLDLNRNGMDDPNGWVTNVNNQGIPILDSSGNVVTNFEVGDPEWIGMLDHPDAPHGPNNKFVSRYAFIAVPVGNTLDMNAIHNQVFDENNAANPTVNPPPNGDNYFRNQGVGSWEINLAAFLADLNTNEWGQVIDPPGVPPSAPTYYQYNQPANFNQGFAFEDACALLAYRYDNNYSLLASVDSLYGGALGAGHFAFLDDNIDGYSDGPLQTTLNTNEFFQPDTPRFPWAGADNTNQFFTVEELFNTNETANFGIHLLNTGTSYFGGTTNSTYDRYTFYRMLDELGSDSAPESDKININYSNAVVNYGYDASSLTLYPTNIAIIPGAETNFVPWATNDFFTVAADRLLRTYTALWATNYITFYTNDSSGNPITNYFMPVLNTNYMATFNVTNSFSITNIPVWVSNRFVYTPAVNRLLQLAANIYDASTTNYYPTVFRPLFSRDQNGLGTNLFVSGYTNVSSVTGAGDLQFALPVTSWDLATTNTQVRNLPVNVYGVPWIIGAKKGFPNFNEFYMESAFQLTRKLMVTRQSTNVPAPAPNPTSSFWGYYAMYNLGLANQFGVECWNSYRSNYTGQINIYMSDDLVMTLTNDENNFSYTTNLFFSALLQTNNWQGYNPIALPLLVPGSFLTNSLTTNFAAVPVSRYLFNSGSPSLNTNLSLWYELSPSGFGQYPQPNWGLTMTNNVRVIIVDTSVAGNWKVIDYVQLGGPYSSRDLTAEILTGYDTVNGGNNTGYNDLWDTNLINGIPNGFAWQFNVSQASTYQQVQSYWNSQDTKSSYDQMNAFRAFTLGSAFYELTYPGYVPDQTLIGAAQMTNAIQMGYTPSATVVQDITWQANDPLVHYTAGDLISPTTGNGLHIYTNWPSNLGALNQRYQPWGGNPSTGVGTNLLAIKDPLVTCSDDWDFPTNKFPTVGWLGRVHRGTPWQTVYLKSSDVLSYQGDFRVAGVGGTNVWVNWTGDSALTYGQYYDAANSVPKKDWLLFDLFTTAFNDNATRGQLSVNVAADNPDPMAGIAAWSALFSGVMVLSNNASDFLIQASRQSAGSITTYTNFPISPAGTNVNSALWQIVQGIYNTRTNFSNPDGVRGAFEHAGYILSVPQLTVQSPFLHLSNYVNNAWVSDPSQRAKGISDEMYEWLPQQVMSLLHAGPPRYVIYCYGQALKPAPDSLVTSGGNIFGMCTNYQVVAESAARAVVRVDGAGTPTPHVVVESFNPLPPD
jgi:hypothetical protein